MSCKEHVKKRNNVVYVTSLVKTLVIGLVTCKLINRKREQDKERVRDKVKVSKPGRCNCDVGLHVVEPKEYWTGVTSYVGTCKGESLVFEVWMIEEIEIPTCQWCLDLRSPERRKAAKWIVITEGPSPLTAPACEDHKWDGDKIVKTLDVTP